MAKTKREQLFQSAIGADQGSDLVAAVGQKSFFLRLQSVKCQRKNSGRESWYDLKYSITPALHYMLDFLFLFLHIT